MPRTLLVIDDNSSVRNALSFLLSRRGYIVLVAEDGLSGIEMARQHAVDGVLLDQHMPGMTGIVVCRLLKTLAAERERSLPIWMMTGARTSELAAAAIAAGAIVMLAKPFDFSELYALLEDKLGKPESPASGKPD